MSSIATAVQQQIDVVAFDRQYSPFIFSYEGQKIVPAESAHGVFEAKQSINADRIDYARHKGAERAASAPDQLTHPSRPRGRTCPSR